MKKQTFLLPVVLLAITFAAQAQDQPTPAAGGMISTQSYEAKAVASDAIKAKFHHQFANTTNEAWASTQNGYLVSFTSGTSQYNVFIDKKGKANSQIRFYPGSELPLAVRNLVNDAYDGFAITTVKEVTTKGSTAYLVTITGANSWKVIRVANDQTDVFEEHAKQ